MPIVHEAVQCPRCGGRGARELNRLPEEGHPVLMCPFCKHTWCEHGRIRRNSGGDNCSSPLAQRPGAGTKTAA